VQLPLPPPLLKLPTGHGVPVGFRVPAAQLYPGGHGAQGLESVELHRPAGHGVPVAEMEAVKPG
jgi:hypothetical protein